MRGSTSDDILRRAAPRQGESLRGAKYMPSLCRSEPVRRWKPEQSLRGANPVQSVHATEAM